MIVDELENELFKVWCRLWFCNEMIVMLYCEIVCFSGFVLFIDDEGVGFVLMECDLKFDVEGIIFLFFGLYFGGGKIECEFKSMFIDVNYFVVYIKDY